jgi:hypothetical protein
MMKYYNVLWIDDKYLEMESFQILAEQNEIILDGYKSYEEAFEILEKNKKKYDAILLDGLFLEKKGQASGTEDVVALGMAIQKINELKSERNYPWFVLSGQDQFTKTESSILKANKKRCFDKTDPRCFAILFKAIKDEANLNLETQIKQKYNKAFEICTDRYIGESSATKLLFLLITVEDQTKNHNTEDKLIAIRKIIELLFDVFVRIGILPSEISLSEGSISKSSAFLRGENPSYKYNEQILHPVIAFQLKNILNITQDGAHVKQELKLGVDNFIVNQHTPYLFNCLIFQLLDILIWCKKYFDEHQNVIDNKNITEKKPDEILTQGVICKDINGNYFCETFLLSKKVIEDNSLIVGDGIQVIHAIINTNPKTKGSYPNFATRINIL